MIISGAVQEGHDLNAAAGHSWAEGCLRRSHGDLIPDGPQDSVVEPVVRFDVGKGILRIRCCSAALGTPEEGYDLGARACLQGAEARCADAVCDAVLHSPEDRTVEIVVFRYVGERVLKRFRLRTSGGTPEEGHDLGAGAGALRHKTVRQRTARHAAEDGPVDRRVRPVAGLRRIGEDLTGAEFRFLLLPADRTGIFCGAVLVLGGRRQDLRDNPVMVVCDRDGFGFLRTAPSALIDSCAGLGTGRLYADPRLAPVVAERRLGLRFRGAADDAGEKTDLLLRAGLLLLDDAAVVEVVDVAGEFGEAHILQAVVSAPDHGTGKLDQLRQELVEGRLELRFFRSVAAVGREAQDLSGIA